MAVGEGGGGGGNSKKKIPCRQGKWRKTRGKHRDEAIIEMLIPIPY